MTRKCALCKGTNYKRTYSFFSAPKDPEIRKKWQAVIPIANYTVGDDTYICSKHFRPNDIVTHWVSGVPPHVVTIKYKKCRLRIGAVPCLNFENDNSQELLDRTDQLEQAAACEDIVSDSVDFAIPREQRPEFIDVNSRLIQSDLEDVHEITDPPLKYRKYNADDKINVDFSRSQYINENRMYTLNNDHIQDSADSGDDTGFNRTDTFFNYKYVQTHTDKYKSLEKLQGNSNNHDTNSHNLKIYHPACSSEISVSHKIKFEQDARALREDELLTESDDPAISQTQHITDTDCARQDDVPEGSSATNRAEDLGNRMLETMQYATEENYHAAGKSDSAACDTMLFEDLLEIYTEVTLPRGWAFLVTSKGHTTTVVYLYMNIPKNHIPIVEKEVYIKSDMVMRCGVGSREINPFHYNLIKDGRSNKVHALSDIEELIDELDQRHICEGGPNVQNYEGAETRGAYVDGMKWRHVGCPIIINNGSPKCSKCTGLRGECARRENKNPRGASFETLLEKRKQIASLRRSLKKITRRNHRLEEIRQSFKYKLNLLLKNSAKSIKHRISSSNMPKIQKLMIKECLNASSFKNKKNVRYSETWVFLCLLLYVESPRLYKYMFVNNYMTLPSMCTIRRYLNQVKTDPQFYNLFQRSVEPYQPKEEAE